MGKVIYLVRNRPLISLLLLVTFLKEIAFLAVVPMWHTPDEQAHFAQVAYFAELNKMPFHVSKDLNREIYESEVLLGTLRDERGNNKFTFHPEYRLEYTNSLEGKYENQIKSLPKEYRQEMVRQEAANYPPLYYILAAIPYKIFYDSDLITRVYLSRLISILMFLGLTFFSYLIAKEIFPKNKLLQIILPTLVSFQPMISFVSSGVTSDNLLNLLFTIFTFVMILQVKNKLNFKYLLISLGLILLLYLTKPQFVLAIPILFITILSALFFNYKSKKMFFVFVSLFPILFFIGYYLVNNRLFMAYLQSIYPQSFYPENAKIQLSFITFLKQTLQHTYAEVIPWYWGVFDWLGVTYPRIVHRILNWLMVFGVVGVFYRLTKLIQKRSKEDFLFIFCILVVLVYFLGITIYNYLFTLSHGFPFGIQGRYYFPVIVSQMAVLLIGLIAFIPKKYFKFNVIWIKVLALLMITFNIFALQLIASTYFDVSSIGTFLQEVSQYKPWFLKGFGIVLLFLGYFLSLGIFIYKFLKIKIDKESNNF